MNTVTITAVPADPEMKITSGQGKAVTTVRVPSTSSLYLQHPLFNYLPPPYRLLLSHRVCMREDVPSLLVDGHPYGGDGLPCPDVIFISGSA